MARRARIQAAGAHYHVGVRGNAGADVFTTDEDRDSFLVTLGHVVERCRWRCFAYCLMTTHYHLVVTTPEPNLASGMGRLNQLYAQWFNRRHDRIGHLFCERYWSQVIETDEQLLTVLRYVGENPVRAGICGRPEEWRWSSAAAMAGRVPAPGFLDVEGYGSLLRPYEV